MIEAADTYNPPAPPEPYTRIGQYGLTYLHLDWYVDGKIRLVEHEGETYRIIYRSNPYFDEGSTTAVLTSQYVTYVHNEKYFVIRHRIRGTHRRHEAEFARDA